MNYNLPSLAWLRPLTASALLVLLSACHSGDVVCTDTYYSLVMLNVADSLTGNPVAVPMTVSWNIDGKPEGTEELTTPGSSFRIQITGGTGVYSIAVHATGYADWSKDDIVVPDRHCGDPVAVVVVVARLQVAP
jgi:hypothetical protein